MTWVNVFGTVFHLTRFPRLFLACERQTFLLAYRRWGTFPPREMSVSGDERGEVSAVRRLRLFPTIREFIEEGQKRYSTFQSRTKWIWVEIVVNLTGDGFLQLTIPTSSLSLQKKYYTRRRRQRDRDKSSRFRLARQQLSTCIMLFCTFVSRHCTTTTWKCLISRFVGDVNARERLCSFSELRYSLRSHCTERFSTGWKNSTGLFVHTEPFNTFALFTRNCRIVILPSKVSNR